MNKYLYLLAIPVLLLTSCKDPEIKSDASKKPYSSMKPSEKIIGEWMAPGKNVLGKKGGAWKFTPSHFFIHKTHKCGDFYFGHKAMAVFYLKDKNGDFYYGEEDRYPRYYWFVGDTLHLKFPADRTIKLVRCEYDPLEQDYSKRNFR